jgi:hypothetical protein
LNLQALANQAGLFKKLPYFKKKKKSRLKRKFLKKISKQANGLQEMK